MLTGFNPRFVPFSPDRGAVLFHPFGKYQTTGGTAVIVAGVIRFSGVMAFRTGGKHGADHSGRLFPQFQQISNCPSSRSPQLHRQAVRLVPGGLMMAFMMARARL